MKTGLNRAAFKISLLFFLIGIFLIGFLVAKHYFILKTVEVFGEKETIENLSQLDTIDNILLLNTNTLAEKLAIDNPLSKKISVKKKFPSSLLIYTEKRIPVVALQNQRDFFFLDEEGYMLFQKESADALPVMHAVSIDVSTGGVVADARIRNGIQIVLNTSKAGFPVTDAKVLYDVNELKMVSDSGQIIVPLNYDATFLFSSLQLLARQFRIEGKQPALIDFRFEKPVVRFIKSE